MRLTGLAVCLAFTAFTAGLVMVQGEYGRLPMTGVTVLLVLSPLLAERLLRCRLALPLFWFALCYAMGPLLGYCYHFYYHISWWDKLLHVFGGVAFALLGLFLFEKFADPEGKRRWMGAVFALCFSMAVAVGWEFFEYGADCWFGMDMQNDTVVPRLTSYLLGSADGKAATIDPITAVTVNGTPLPVSGYIDIGLNDTMGDMLLETLGAMVTVGLLVWDRGRHRLFRKVEE